MVSNEAIWTWRPKEFGATAQRCRGDGGVARELQRQYIRYREYQHSHCFRPSVYLEVEPVKSTDLMEMSSTGGDEEADASDRPPISYQQLPRTTCSSQWRRDARVLGSPLLRTLVSLGPSLLALTPPTLVQEYLFSCQLGHFLFGLPAREF